jgi:hypothetical protein
MDLKGIAQELKRKGSKESVSVEHALGMLECLIQLAQRVGYKYPEELEKLRQELTNQGSDESVSIESAHDMNCLLLEIAMKNNFGEITRIEETQFCLDMELLAPTPVISAPAELMLRICEHLLAVTEEAVAA